MQTAGSTPAFFLEVQGKFTLSNYLLESLTFLSDDTADTIQETTAAVNSAQEAMDALNNALMNRTGARAALYRPPLLQNVEELMVEPPPPEFPLEDDEDEFIIQASECLLLLNDSNTCSRLKNPVLKPRPMTMTTQPRFSPTLSTSR